MKTTLTVVSAGPLMTVQDLGRPGHTGVGLSRGGAMDRLAVLEGAALLGLTVPGHAIEMAGGGGTFRTDQPLRFALTGARMAARIDDAPLRWNATHILHPGEVLRIGGMQAGTYGYLCFALHVLGNDWLGSAATHLSVGIGQALTSGGTLTFGDAQQPDVLQRCFDPDERLSGGHLRIMPGPQTQMFDEATLSRFIETSFQRNAQSNRTGLLLDNAGEGFRPSGGTNPMSDFIACGDVQMTGEGTPFVLLAECQTIGGYPRIGTIIAADLPRAAQTPAAAPMRFVWVTAAEADTLFKSEAQLLADLRAKVRPLVRNPADIHDLLSYQLISGMTAGDELEPMQ